MRRPLPTLRIKHSAQKQNRVCRPIDDHLKGCDGSLSAVAVSVPSSFTSTKVF